MELSWRRTGQLLVAIVLLGAVLRFWGLGTNSFVADEFLDMNGSYGYAQTGEWQSWDWNFGRPAEMNRNEARDERAIVYKWQVAQLFMFLPPTEAVARSVSVLWGLFSIVVVFWAGWFYTRKKEIGLIAAFLFAVSIAGIMFDRRLRMYAMFFPLFLIFATLLFACLERAYQGKQAWLRAVWQRYRINLLYALPALFFGGLSLLTHQLTVNIAPLAASYVGILAWHRFRKDGNLKNKYAVLFVGGIVLSALALFVFRDHLQVFSKELSLFDDHYSYFGYLLGDFAHPLFGALLAALGACVMFRQLKEKEAAWWLSLSVLVPLLMAVFVWSRNAGPQYIFFAQSFLIILAAAGIYGTVAFVRTQVALFGRRAPLLVLLALLILTPHYGYFLEENNTYHETSSGDNPNYRKVFGYFKREKQPGDVLITRNFRNYYFAGAEVPVYDFGGELSREKFSLSELEMIVAKHPSGWVIFSGNDRDYLSKAAENHMIKHFEKVDSDQVRGDVSVYRWGNSKTQVP